MTQWIDVWRKQIKNALKQVPARKCQHASDECQHVSDRDAKPPSLILKVYPVLAWNKFTRKTNITLPKWPSYDI